ncbi:cation-transporting atpase [Leptolyngbya sp. Heron Island J]|uniref:cation-translocating P-type ATPase n=1 Tax=Leptolyngbya sp. Heron Island J TaxID=1385935 RepID=UPI0003B9B42D|nr:HAD-IC family P-type ATPase [Leptolyngbya sp. Heron Island J]ESA33825.1 cation-transporting atpase [Leptolyngbya sp. Heron Island J]
MQPLRSTPWHASSSKTVFNSLQSTPHGLTQLDAQWRLQQVGANHLPQQPGPSYWQLLLRQFRSPLIYILAIAALGSVAIGDLKDAGFIMAVLMLNAVIGGYQEWRAEQSSRALQQLLKIRAAVMRDGEVCEIDADDVVPGDVVWLESGNRIPADIRLIHTHNLEVDESLLTGESLTILKNAGWIGEESIPLADRLNMVYAGSMVVRGRGRGIVVATATATAVGQLALDMMATAGGKPPLLKRMEQFSQVVALSVVIAAVGIALLGILKHGYKLVEMFLFSVALAVSAIPEGLPVALTVALAVTTRRMAKRGVIVRRLPAVEGLGSCTLIASDKTGTLTCNELTVRQICLPNGDVFEVTGEGFTPVGHVLFQGKMITPDHVALDRIARTAVLCNEADLHHSADQWAWRGDPTDIALLTMAYKLGWSREPTLNLYPQVNEIPFEPEHQFSATYHAIEEQIHVMVKGAPERLHTMCEVLPGPSPWRFSQQMAEQGYRVLALATGIVPDSLDSSQVPPEPSQLKLLGFVGMIDPLRPGVKDAIACCHTAGIAVWMITGDHPATALAIARDLNLATTASQVVTGQTLVDQSPQEIQQLIQTTCVFARIAPHQKLQLVNAATACGHFVAVTGDGINDAPALRAANIGVAMGKAGTDVAREAAELVISNDNFTTIVAGIEEGRIAYDNIRKVIYLLVSTGAAEIILLSLAVATSLPLPLLPVQLLWLNLVTNGIQDVALAFEPGENGILRRRPRSPREPIFNRLMIERTLLGAMVMGVVGFIIYNWMLMAGQPVSAARNTLLLLMVLFEIVHIGNCRSESKSIFQLSPLRSPILLLGTIIAFLVHVLMMYVPLGQSILAVEPVSLETWGILILLSLTVLAPIELHKLSQFQRPKKIF